MRLIRPEPTPIPMSTAWIQSLEIMQYQSIPEAHKAALRRALEREHQRKEMRRNGVTGNKSELSSLSRGVTDSGCYECEKQQLATSTKRNRGY